MVVSSNQVKIYDLEDNLQYAFTLGDDLILRKFESYYCFSFKYAHLGKSRWVQAFIPENFYKKKIDVYGVKVPGDTNVIGQYGFTMLEDDLEWDFNDHYYWDVSEKEYLDYVFNDENMVIKTYLGSRGDMEEYAEEMEELYSNLLGVGDGENDYTDYDCLAGDCQNGYGAKVYGDNFYTGFFKDGNRHYFGAYFFESGSYYIGTWFNDEHVEEFLHGIYSYAPGIHPELPDGGAVFPSKPRSASDWGETGCVSGDCEDGWGVYIWSDGDMHVGNWKNGEPHLTGVKFWSSGDFWMGMYNEGDRKTNRHGLYVWDDGDYKIYTDAYKPYESGCISGDCNDGFGTYVYSSGGVHSGFWNDAKQDYFSFKFWIEGDKY